MNYLNISNNNMEKLEPNVNLKQFSDREKVQFKNLFFFFKNKKGFTDKNAEIITEMIIFKQKYKGLKYSDEQENTIKKVLEYI
jgi:hypothetical protein